MLSPTPNKNNPKQSNKKVSNLGIMILDLRELQDVIGTELIKKASEINLNLDLNNLITHELYLNFILDLFNSFMLVHPINFMSLSNSLRYKLNAFSTPF